MSFKKLSAVLLTVNFLFLSACDVSEETDTESVTSVPYFLPKSRRTAQNRLHWHMPNFRVITENMNKYKLFY